MKNPPNKSITDSLRNLQEGRVKQKNQSGIIEKLVAHRKNETNEKDVASEFENALTKIRDKNKNNARINFSWSDLSEIEFKRNPQLSYDGSSFFGSTISTINKKLTNLSFQNIDFGFAKLSWVDLSGANLTNANLSRANLTKADLSRTNLTGANLTSADLDTANLTEANLTNADLSKANLTGANLSGADLTGAKFRGVIQNTITLEAIPDFTELGVKTILYLLKDGGLSDNQKKEMLGIGNEVPVSKYLQGLIEQSRDDKIKSDVKKVLEVAEDFEKKIKTKKRSASFVPEDRNSKNGRWGARVKNEENIPLDQSRVR